ncbi:MAG: tRNA (guanosine(46)-N7)-methyltransferase TrmB [Phycisphaeraceae bacterium]|nr:tRNA (guanosine(46)-N7)-methyltransferase TrmB [Phycisphaeraceae bacterium]
MLNDRVFMSPLQCERGTNNFATFAQVGFFMTQEGHIPHLPGKSGRFSGGKLGHGRELDVAKGKVGVSTEEYPALPDEVMTNPLAGRLDPRRWFADPERRFEIEIGCGKGTFMLNVAKENPETNFLGIEWEGAFFAYTADRVRRAALDNVRMLHADAVEFLKWRCPDAIVNTIHLYYSDPWPKTKHHKNRVVQDKFLEQAWRVLVPGGELRIVTDHDDYWAWMQTHFARWTDAKHAAGHLAFTRESFVAPEWVGEGEVVATNYEKKMCGDTKQPHAAVLRKP